MRLLLEQPAESPQMFRALALYEHMKEIAEESAEHMYAVALDTKRHVNGVYLVSKGGVDICCVDPREVFKFALTTNSSGFALVHNHPSGDPTPSKDDFALSERMERGAYVLGLDFLDFMIIATGGKYVSFRESGKFHDGGADGAVSIR